MADDKDSSSFFRKVVKFVANPATDWADLDKREDARQTEYLKSELKAIVERKRRNDFVRKRELDMLRKLRREGITEGSSTLARLSSLALDSDDSRLERNDSDIVKQKIDEIEQQMSGEIGAPRRAGPAANDSAHARAHAPTEPMDLPAAAAGGKRDLPRYLQPTEPMPLEPAAAPAVTAAGLQQRGPQAPGDDAPVVEVNEVAHDPELDEAVISFANADFSSCENALSRLITPGGTRADTADTWMVMFDLYRAIGKQPRFESLAVEYAQRFGLSAPQWFSMPQLVAEAEAGSAPAAQLDPDGTVAWFAPERLDLEAVGRLQSTLLQAPLPWTLDWSPMTQIEPQAAQALRELLRNWAGEPVNMHWNGVKALFETLEDATPTGDRNTDPAVWLLRLEVLRVINQAMRYDEVALDYCITYEVSPPAWEAAQCSVEVDLNPSSSLIMNSDFRLSRVGGVSTRYVESETEDEDTTQSQEEASLTLSGQLVGDIGPLLKGLDGQIGAAGTLHIDCGLLIRVDFIAAGDLLNWVLAKRAENRQVNFLHANRLVALFFGAMGISEHARVSVRHV